MNAVITGATKGIGRAIAENMAHRGMNICVCSRNQDDLDNMQNTFAESYPNIKLYVKKADLSQKTDVLEFGNFCIDKMGSVDALVNNAGVFTPGLLLEEEDGALEHMIETNLYSAYYITRLIAPQMVKQKSGYIINIASIASLMAYPNGGSYSISKFALRGFSMVLREELKETGIKVTTVMPGATWSNSWAGVDLPESRLMQASDIATSICSLFDMSPAAVVEELVLRPQLGDL